MTDIWRERLRATGGLAFGLLLMAGLIALIFWNSPMPQKRTETTVTLLPPPIEEHPAHLPQLAMSQRMLDAVQGRPKPRSPKPQAPQVPAPTVAEPLAEESVSNANPYNLPQQADAGFTIGGNNAGGGVDGSGCGAADYYLALITSQLKGMFMSNEKLDSRKFHVEARIWFDGIGSLRQGQLLQSTGDTSLDTTITHLIAGVRVGTGMPQCVQPVTVWVSQPWDTALGDADEMRAGQAAMASRHAAMWEGTYRPAGQMHRTP
jgi:hypothetical protein